MRVRPILAALVCLVLSLACGIHSEDPPPRPVTPSGTLTLRLGADSFPGYDRVVLNLEKVEGTTDGTHWTFLGNVQSTVDLMALQNGNSTVILAAAVPSATYTQFRITWATVNYQVATDWPAYVFPTGNITGQQLAMPATTVVNGTVTVATSASSTALIMLAGQQAVANRISLTYPYTFQATGNAYDLGALARITGLLTDGSTPLAGVEVYAETVDLAGLATIQRRAFTDAAGHYALEGLPAGSLYFIVAQPWNYASAYQAGATSVNAAAATGYIGNLPFSGQQVLTNDLFIVVTPPSTLTPAVQGTWAELRQPLATGSAGTKTLIVRSQLLDVGQYQDQTDIYGLYPGSYEVAAQRSTSGAAPVMKVGAPVTLGTGSFLTTTLTFP